MTGVEISLIVMLAIYVLTVVFAYWAIRRYSLMSGNRLDGSDVAIIFVPIINFISGIGAMNATPGCRTFIEIFYRIEYPKEEDN